MNNAQSAAQLSKVFKIVLEVIAIVLISFALFEVFLRAAPQLIPLEILNGFNQTLRAEVAERLNLQTQSDLRYETDKRGYQVPLYKPGVSISLPVHQADIKEGGARDRSHG